MKRRLVVLLLLLVGGAIVNVAVAWGCAYSASFSAAAGTDHFARSLRWFAHKHRCGMRVWFLADDSDEAVRSTATDGLPRWIEWPTTYPRNYEDHNFMGWMEFHDAFGWPLLSMACSWRTQTSYLAMVPDGFVLEDHATGDHGERERAIPLRPIWPGFVINTVFYAVVLCLLFAGPFVVRRRRRIRRGLCPKCAYDLRGTPQDATACPECGARWGSPECGEGVQGDAERSRPTTVVDVSESACRP